MDAVICNELGGPDKLTVERDLPIPQPGQGEVVIKVSGAGVNFPDVLVTQGLYQFKPELPFSPGGEVAGKISALGEGVSDWKLGDRVAYMSLTGGFRTHLIAKASGLIRVPGALPLTSAGGMIITYGTAMHALVQRGNLKNGETVLVLGAAGGVGLAAIELAKAMGAKVIAAASTEAKLKTAKSLGADFLINYSKSDLRNSLRDIVGAKGLDLVVDPVGGELFEPALRSCAWGGRYLVIGFASGSIPKIPANLPLLKGCSVVGVFWGEFRLRNVKADNANFNRIFSLVSSGKVNPLISHVLPLEEATKALNMLAQREAQGKIVLAP